MWSAARPIPTLVFLLSQNALADTSRFIPGHWKSMIAQAESQTGFQFTNQKQADLAFAAPCAAFLKIWTKPTELNIVSAFAFTSLQT